jgi:hypothetical protein
MGYGRSDSVTGGNGGSMTTLYFTAGPNREQDGLFGAIDPQ